MLTLRTYQPQDAHALLALFRDTVRRVNCRDYSAVQVTAWSSDEIDEDHWTGRFQDHFAVVAELHGTPVGFADMDDHGYIDRIFVSSQHQRCGVGRLLLHALMMEGDRKGLIELTTDASITARPFFEVHSFVVVRQQLVQCRGVDFINFRMVRRTKSVLPAKTVDESYPNVF